jgi:hypothetical protein
LDCSRKEIAVRKSLSLPVVFLAGIALGAGGWDLLAPERADAQGVKIGFSPVTVASSQGDKQAIAWFIGKDGSVQVCASNAGPGGATATNCQKVNLQP